MKRNMTITALSDTHGYHRDVEVPNADVLIFAGDLMTDGWSKGEVIDFARWFSNQPHKHKIVVAGNHDRLFESNETWCVNQFADNVVYLRDEYCVIDGVKFYGSPVQPWFHHWAFNVFRGEPIKEYWDRIPLDTDVLITHGPPYGFLDQIMPEPYTPVFSNIVRLPSEHLGCEELTKALEIVRPRLHFFGHIHGSYGTYTGQDNMDGVVRLMQQVTDYHNVAICNESYWPVNAPHRVTLEIDRPDVLLDLDPDLDHNGAQGNAL